ncbi:response regulator transcription factor [Streptacidiphilus sp. P02-A3a]|nr:response regulator transcription factor [Streptacidiphilus sp. P02-A3a]
MRVRDRRPQLHRHAFDRGGQVDRPAAQQLGHEEQRAPGGGDRTGRVADQCADRHADYGALRAGASGFLLKSMALDAILDAIRVVAAGDALIAPSVTRRLIADFAGTSGPAVPEPDAEPAADPRLLAGITDREREVLALVGQGLSNTEIAERLVISAATAKTHVARLFAKLKARDRVQLAIIAFETGLVPRRR